RTAASTTWRAGTRARWVARAPRAASWCGSRTGAGHRAGAAAKSDGPQRCGRIRESAPAGCQIVLHPRGGRGYQQLVHSRLPMAIRGDFLKPQQVWLRALPAVLVAALLVT